MFVITGKPNRYRKKKE